jgi:hypothetical protein
MLDKGTENSQPLIPNSPLGWGLEHSAHCPIHAHKEPFGAGFMTFLLVALLCAQVQV